MEFQENNIDYIIAHINEPESLVEPEFVEWLGDEGHRRLFEEIRNQREAFMRSQLDSRVDMDKELKRLRKGIQPKRSGKWLNWLAVAASVVVLFTASVFLWHSRISGGGDVQLATLEGRRSAELILANGERINLENNVIELRESGGVLISNDSNYSLSYRKDSLPSGEVKGQGLVYHTINVPAGADYVVKLSDGTLVRLNCETTFRFPVSFAANERRVYLDGEAFFEVSKRQARPFIVEADQMQVKVTGTSFNVKSYSGEEWGQTTLVDGSVEVSSEQASESPVHLDPSWQYSVNKRTHQVEVKEVDVSLYTGWTDGMFVFKNQRLEEVMNTLARWYSLEVFYANASLKDLRLSANLGRYEHVDSLLNVIRAMDKVSIERKGDVVIVSNKVKSKR